MTIFFHIKKLKAKSIKLVYIFKHVSKHNINFKKMIDFKIIYSIRLWM